MNGNSYTQVSVAKMHRGMGANGGRRPSTEQQFSAGTLPSREYRPMGWEMGAEAEEGFLHATPRRKEM
uniref:Uncharacterized protein n=1 Tax=Plectus sambesii TaxID=2011161 RepID=A0A914V3M9_9BILA